MNNQKVEEALKQIFDHYGVGIVSQQGKFRSSVYDLLDEWNYRDERLVLRNAIESNALLPLVTASPITGEVAENAVEQLKKAGHMTEEDAEFVARCFIAVCGGNPEVVTEKRRQEAEKRREEERKQQEQQEAAQKRREEEQRQQEEAQRRREEEQKQQEEAQRRREEERRRQEEERRREEAYREEQQRRRKEEADKEKEKKMAVVATVICAVIAVGLFVLLML